MLRGRGGVFFFQVSLVAQSLVSFLLESILLLKKLILFSNGGGILGVQKGSFVARPESLKNLDNSATVSATCTPQ